MRVLRAAWLAAAFLTIAAGMLGAAAWGGASASSVTVAIESAQTGDEAAVDLYVTGLTPPGLGAWNIDIAYDASRLQPVSCQSQGCNIFFAPGTVRVGFFDANGRSADPEVLATITFECIASGQASLNLTVQELTDTDTQAIPHSVQNGAIQCEGDHLPTPAPTPTPDPDATPTATPGPGATPTPIPTGTPRPTGTPIATLGPGQTPTPTPAPTGTPLPPLQGDTDCNGLVNTVDALMVLRDVAGLAHSAACLDLAGDVNCDGEVDAIDSLGILRYVAALLPLAAPAGCPAVGQPL